MKQYVLFFYIKSGMFRFFYDAALVESMSTVNHGDHKNFILTAMNFHGIIATWLTSFVTNRFTIEGGLDEN